MPNLARKLNSPVVHDVVFGMVGLGSLATLVLAGGHGAPAIEAAAQPLRTGATLVALLVTATALGTTSSRLDNGKDEYVFRVLAKSALIGMLSLVFSAVFWGALFADNLGELSATTLLALGLGGWSLGYLYTRIRGTSE